MPLTTSGFVSRYDLDHPDEKARLKVPTPAFERVLKTKSYDTLKKKKKAKQAMSSDTHPGSCDPKTGEPTERSTFS
jgi:hypothetical protein